MVAVPHHLAHEDPDRVIDPGSVEAACPALDAMHCIAFLKQQLRKVAAVLAGDASYQGVFAVAHS